MNKIFLYHVYFLCTELSPVEEKESTSKKEYEEEKEAKVKEAKGKETTEKEAKPMLAPEAKPPRSPKSPTSPATAPQVVEPSKNMKTRFLKPVHKSASASQLTLLIPPHGELSASALWIWKGVSATLQSGGYTLSYPRGRPVNYNSSPRD